MSRKCTKTCIFSILAPTYVPILGIKAPTWQPKWIFWSPLPLGPQFRNIWHYQQELKKCTFFVRFYAFSAHSFVNFLFVQKNKSSTIMKLHRKTGSFATSASVIALFAYKLSYFFHNFFVFFSRFLCIFMSFFLQIWKIYCKYGHFDTSWTSSVIFGAKTITFK